jgi:NAD+ diphosphatase
MSFIPEMAFAGGPLDLAENERTQEQLTAFSKAKNARALIMHHGDFLATKDGGLALVPPMDIVGKHLYDPGPLFLGLDGDTPLFAFSFAKEAEADAMVKDAQLDNLRTLAGQLNPVQLSLAGRAKSLFDWHRTHQFCATCGEKSAPQKGGAQRKCPACTTDHFPRVNPVVIMMVLHGDQCLLGRGPDWPEGAYSALAGFISPGETLEEACIREVMEEVGIPVSAPTYQFCQPWPFPSQLMMGVVCEAQSTNITLNTKELADAQWFSKDNVRAVFNGEEGEFVCPPKFTIAYQLIAAWLAE